MLSYPQGLGAGNTCQLANISSLPTASGLEITVNMWRSSGSLDQGHCWLIGTGAVVAHWDRGFGGSLGQGLRWLLGRSCGGSLGQGLWWLIERDCGGSMAGAVMTQWKGL